MKKNLLTILGAMFAFGGLTAQVNTIITAPVTTSANGTSGNRGPNGTVNHTVMRAMYHVPSAELSALSPTVSSFGFVLTSGVATAAGGTITVYLQNTPATSYTLGTTWNTTGFTQVYSGVYNIPVGGTAANIDFQFPSNFTYTPGQSLHVAYEYTASTTVANPAIYTCYAPTPIQGATGATNTIGSPTLGTTAFRPLYRFGTPNTVSNDISVNYVVANGHVPANSYSASAPSAEVRNNSNVALTNVAVGYSVSGLSNLSGSIVIPSLGAGITTVVTMPSYTFPITANGLNNITFAVIPDQVNSNNVATRSQSIQCNKLGLGATVTDFSTTAVGFNTGSGIIYSSLMTPNTSTLDAAIIAISSGTSNTGNNVYAVLANAGGTIIATSNTISLGGATNGTYATFTFAPQTLTGGTSYLLGLAQPSNAVGYFPVASSTVPVVAPGSFFTGPLAGGSATNLNANLGYLGIQGRLVGVCTTTTVGFSSNVIANNDVVVYPNPANNGKTVISGLEGDNTITVFNVLGQSIINEKTSNEVFNVDLSNQVKGTYLIKITNANNVSKTLKVINN